MKIKSKQLNITNGKLVVGSSTATTETSFTFPTSDGSENQVLQTNGSGAVSWATISSGSTTSISDADSDTKIQVEESSDEDKIRFDTAGSERMIITDAGKVGIGVSSPSRILDIDGDLVVRGGDIHGNATGNPAISVNSTTTDVTVPNKLTVDGDGSSDGIKLSDGLIEMRTGTGNVAQIDMYCEVSNVHKISLKAPAHSTFSGDINFVLPSSHGSNGQYLKTDGSGNTSWGTVSGGGGSSHTVNVNFSHATPSAAVALSYSSANNEEIYIMSPTANITVTLPHIADNSIPEGYKVNIKNLSSSYSITVSPSGDSPANRIDASTSITHLINTQYENITLVADNDKTWYRI